MNMRVVGPCLGLFGGPVLDFLTISSGLRITGDGEFWVFTRKFINLISIILFSI